MRQALVRSMADSAGVETDGAQTLWRSKVLRSVTRARANYSAHEAAKIFLRRTDHIQYLVLMPSLMVFDQNGSTPPPEIATSIKNEILGYQHNKPFNQAVNAWRETLFGKQPMAVFEFPPNSGSTFKFQVRRSPAFASIGLSGTQRAHEVPERLKPLIKYHGVQLAEPFLLFSNKEGTAPVKDTHPIRGILRNRPYDFSLTSRGLASSVRIGVVCPAAETQTLDTYLQSINRTLKPHSTERDYLLDYPGFQTAYARLRQ